MHLLNDIAPEVYRAYFPQSLAATEAVSLDATDAGCEHNYKKWPPSELSNFFPRDKICADDPYSVAHYILQPEHLSNSKITKRYGQWARHLNWKLRRIS